MSLPQAVNAILRRLRPFVLLFLGTQFLIRLILTVISWKDLSAAPEDWLLPFLFGFLSDVQVLLPITALLMIGPLLLPASLAGTWFDRTIGIAAFAFFLFLMALQAAGEYFFWDEFTTRFNFIAVDYLVYTQEILQNIVESYPVYPLLTFIALVAIAGTWMLRDRITAACLPHPAFPQRAGLFAATALVAAATTFAAPSPTAKVMPNAVARELGGNGLYGLVNAFFSNEIDFAGFYRTIPEIEAAARTRVLLAEQHEPFESADLNDLTRRIRSDGHMLRKNVVLVVMESMSAGFMGVSGNPRTWTPNLDRLAREGLFFSEMRATGTRTVRGLEAIALSIPPTPGQSILRRPGNDGLFTIGSVFQDAGYDTRFIYGGYGYFDNMNAFFSGNGFGIVDRGSIASAHIRFANAWGISDGDLYDEVLRQADASAARGRNFFNLVLTTSNHRPFTYPGDATDIPSPGSREGAVRYADHAIGGLIARAAAKPWFRDTVFIFVADHTASVAGKVELDVDKYHVPCIFWSPGFIEPRRFDRMASQIDVAPTLLQLLHTSYRSRFFGDDLVSPDEAERPVYISNYQKVAMILHRRTTILEPKKEVVQLEDNVVQAGSRVDKQAVEDTIAVYQTASHWRRVSRRIATGLGDAGIAAAGPDPRVLEPGH